MKRSRSPVSEGTIRNLIEDDYLSDSFISDITNDGSSDSSVVDDTDNDPDFDPNQPQTSSGIRGLGFRHHFSTNNDSESDSDDSDCDHPSRVRHRLVHTQPRPHPVQTAPQNRSEILPNDEVSTSSESEDEDGWIEVNEENDHLHRPNHSISFHELPGPKHCPVKDSPPSSYFKMFFTASLIDVIVKFTNKYGREFIVSNRDKLKRHSRVQNWKPVTPAEIYAFIIVLINMGVKKMPTIESYWWTSQSQVIPWFSRMFTRNRFQAILKFFHLVDTKDLPRPKENGYDPCARFNPLVEHMNQVSKLYFTPDKNLSIDESMIATKNHSQLLQYMPKKHHRWGVKLWMLCDAVSHYCVSFFVYKGADGDYKTLVNRKGLGFSVVDTLLRQSNLYEKGHHVYIDNFFSSIRLAKYLFLKGTFVTGTLRHNRKGIPKEMKAKFAVGQTKYMRRNPMILLGYRQKKSQKKQVLVLSTSGTTEAQSKSKRRGTKVFISSKPSLIRAYNSFMGGVDGSDQMLYQYQDDRKNMKCWKKVALNLFGRMMLNAYILYKMNTTKPLSHLEFIVSVVDEMSRDWITEQETRRPSAGPSPRGTPNLRGEGDADFFEKIGDRKEKNCCVCSLASTKSGGKRKKSSYMCVKCKKGVHTKCYPLHVC